MLRVLLLSAAVGALGSSEEAVGAQGSKNTKPE